MSSHLSADMVICGEECCGKSKRSSAARDAIRIHLRIENYARVGIIAESKRGRPHRATLIGGALIVISHPLRLVVGGTNAWLAFASWITQWT